MSAFKPNSLRYEVIRYYDEIHRSFVMCLVCVGANDDVSISTVDVRVARPHISNYDRQQQKSQFMFVSHSYGCAAESLPTTFGELRILYQLMVLISHAYSSLIYA